MDIRPFDTRLTMRNFMILLSLTTWQVRINLLRAHLMGRGQIKKDTRTSNLYTKPGKNIGAPKILRLWKPRLPSCD